MTTTLRNYNGGLDRWELVGADAGSGLQNTGTAHKEGTRFYDIGSDRFSWTADRSPDGGKTWESGFQQIEARRVGPPRSMGPLATAKKQSDTVPPPKEKERTK